MIAFTEHVETVIEHVNSKKFATIGKKREALVKALEAFSKRVQADVQNYLKNKRVKYESFWINNVIIIKNANYDLVKAISEIKGVAQIRQEHKVKLLESSDPINLHNGTEHRLKRSTPAAGSWGIERIQANQVWQFATGQSVVIAGIDSGVRYTHEALIQNWRRDYGWFDPIRGLPVPTDAHGHGTHTIGTAVGRNGIGVAPEAKWIACRGLDVGDTPESMQILCGQWVVCPTLPNGLSPNCNMAPDIVLNSWRSPLSDYGFYDHVINVWHAANIIPVFAIGNSGPNCETAKSPGDRPNVIGVGNTDSSNRINPGSSLEPALNNAIKPDVVAPGTDIRSVAANGDSQYAIMTGSSMAAPHVAGLIALLIGRRPGLTYRNVYQIIVNSAGQNVDEDFAPNCDNINPTTFPGFGYGLIDTIRAFNVLLGNRPEL